MNKVSDMEACIPLSADFMAEVHWWHDLLPKWNGISLIYDQHWTANADFKLWTDASGAGFGAYWDGAHLSDEFSSWAQAQTMAFKELYVIIAAIATWGSTWGGKKIRIYCDNKSVCQILHHCNSCSAPVAALLCTLYCLSVKFRFLISAVHLLGVDNVWRDRLSQGWLEKFYASCLNAAPFPTPIGNFVLGFSDDTDSRTRCPHSNLATAVTHQLNKVGFSRLAFARTNY